MTARCSTPCGEQLGSTGGGRPAPLVANIPAPGLVPHGYADDLKAAHVCGGTCVLGAYVSVYSGAPHAVCWYTEVWGGTHVCTVVHLMVSACAWRSATLRLVQIVFLSRRGLQTSAFVLLFILGTCSRASSEVVVQITKEENCLLYQLKSLK